MGRVDALLRQAAYRLALPEEPRVSVPYEIKALPLPKGLDSQHGTALAFSTGSDGHCKTVARLLILATETVGPMEE